MREWYIRIEPLAENSSGIKVPEPPSDALDHLGVDGGVGSVRPWYAPACAAVETSSGSSSRRTRAIPPLLSRAHAYQPGLELSRQGRGPVSLADPRNPTTQPAADCTNKKLRVTNIVLGREARAKINDAHRFTANVSLSETNEYSLAFYKTLLSTKEAFEES